MGFEESVPKIAVTGDALLALSLGVEHYMKFSQTPPLLHVLLIGKSWIESNRVQSQYP